MRVNPSGHHSYNHKEYGNTIISQQLLAKNELAPKLLVIILKISIFDFITEFQVHPLHNSNTILARFSCSYNELNIPPIIMIVSYLIHVAHGLHTHISLFHISKQAC